MKTSPTTVVLNLPLDVGHLADFRQFAHCLTSRTFKASSRCIINVFIVQTAGHDVVRALSRYTILCDNLKGKMQVT